MENIQFTPRGLQKLENEFKKPLPVIVSEFSVNTVVALIANGLNADSNKALQEIDGYLENGGDMMQLYFELLEKLIKAGFLPRALMQQLEAAKATIDNPQVTTQLQDSLANSGVSLNQQQ